MAKPKTARANPALRLAFIRQLHVYDPVYMLRQPVDIPNLKALLMDGGTPPAILLEKMGLETTNAPSQTNTSPAPASK